MMLNLFSSFQVYNLFTHGQNFLDKISLFHDPQKTWGGVE